MKKLILSPYFSYVYLFVVVITAIFFFRLADNDPLKAYTIPILLVFVALQQYRKYLLRKENK
ncbi:hypothetical protein J5U18_11585 [Sphingobacteriaceae bacterium WQ 2009]|uniref:Uncharacterized protein n=1 Tax=Rhinopithecimicrobium faecis TaxID=2820698 RepID=A0A8T4HDI6_9SPHI|nr:hypothetical protein [Sphingobacteriaceae bacterium WQ 2009]